MRMTRTLLFVFILILLVGCTNAIPFTLQNGGTNSSTETISPSQESTVIPSITVEPTPDVPFIAIVNEEGIRLGDYEEEIRRYEAAIIRLEQEFEEEQAKLIVLQSMIDTVLLAQAARENGYILEQDGLNIKVSNLINDVGGEPQFQQWLDENFYSQESFLRVYKLELEAVWMRDKIIGEVPLREEQIRARQIVVSNKTLAEDIYRQLENGIEFDYYAWGYDQLSGGELGWFPREYLILPQIENEVFNLQAGEYT
ncbi:MAG TPA: hypothetical protein VK856_04600, partial [Anaerolineaceae bacterium]|nr:hypothetical protein [Anaerolineaceae bacterium]